jgi:hypothetical protein
MTREAKPFTRFVSAVDKVHDHFRSIKQLLGEVCILFTSQNALLTPS